MIRRGLATAVAVLAVGAGACGGDSGGDTPDGKAVFATAGCGTCHSLQDAGGTGAVGPDLDALKPNATKVEVFVTNGSGQMPSFKGQLSDDEIKAVAAYVSEVTGGNEDS